MTEELRLRNESVEWREIEGEVVAVYTRKSIYIAVNRSGEFCGRHSLKERPENSSSNDLRRTSRSTADPPRQTSTPSWACSKSTTCVAFARRGSFGHAGHRIRELVRDGDPVLSLAAAFASACPSVPVGPAAAVAPPRR
jgi:hypothetical protein